jgi:hypothetical protein
VRIHQAPQALHRFAGSVGQLIGRPRKHLTAEAVQPIPKARVAHPTIDRARRDPGAHGGLVISRPGRQRE